MKKWLKIPMTKTRYIGKVGQKPVPVKFNPRPSTNNNRLSQNRYLIMIL
jgi:hypothetical protein